MLRLWQEECIRHAELSYQTQSHYLILASPGAGKTRVAAHIAKGLLSQNLIDYIVCFSPSRVVALNIEETFQSVLGRLLHGRLGAIGVSKTYHSLNTADKLISDLRHSRVLVVFDEIHHCAGDGMSEANSWGLHLLTSIQELATYTLSLTGTPWRTDTLPLPFARYTDPEGNILCDFAYGLSEAIRDQVCRRPQVTAIDIEGIAVKRNYEVNRYSGLSALLESGELSYRELIKYPDIIKYLLGRGISKLTELRKTAPRAAGLIVASSYEHALQIQSLLVAEFGKTATIVSYYQEDSGELIKNFRDGDSEWIISIAMISEGTDIPRLQVCCHLTDVTTELYFRQILGRIIRTTPSQEDQAYLYILAEPNLVKYAERLNEDVPGCYVYERSEYVDKALLNINSDGTSHPSAYLQHKVQSVGQDSVNAEVLFSGLESTESVAIEIQLETFKERILESYLVSAGCVPY